MRIDLTSPVELWHCRIPTPDDPVLTMQIYNMSDKDVRSIQVCVHCYDAEGDQYARHVERLQGIDGPGRHVFEASLEVEEAEYAQDLEVIIEKVWFDDNTIWRKGVNEPMEFKPSPLLSGPQLQVMQELAGPDAASYPSDQGAVWVCVCGRPNSAHEDTCRRCRRDKHAIFTKLNEASIERVLFTRQSAIEDEQRRQREDARRQAAVKEARQRRLRRRRRIILTTLISILLVIGLIYGIYFHGIPYYRYYQANRTLENGQFDSAKAQFLALADYRDSASLALECDYRAAMNALNGGTYTSLRAAQNGFAQDADEERKEYFERLRDKFGLTLKEESKREIEFTRARDALAERYRLEGKSARARAVLNLRYGTFTDIGVKQAKKDETLIRYLNHNYKNYAEILRAREAKSLDPDVEATLPPMESVELFPNFSLADFKRLTTMMEPVDSEKDYLELSQLRYWPDFRRALSMAEYARFANEIGIHQKLQKVFSMPLGVNEITLGEITTAYQTLLTGKVYKCLDADWADPCFIKEIKNRDGRVIFRNEVETKQVLSDTVTSQMAVMLRSVFTNGTARSQVANLSVSSEDRSTTLRFPVMGKTGTTNDYRNVAFMGALPTYVAEQNGVALDSVVAIGSYVGFDDNKPLKSGRTRIAGASGGLPQWAAFAKEEIDIQGIPEHIDFFDISMLATGEVPLVLPNERGELKVDPMTGFVLPESEASAGRTLPWLEVPGFRAAVAEAATDSAASVEAAPAPELSIVPVEDGEAAQTEASAAQVGESAEPSGVQAPAAATEQPSAPPAPAAATEQPPVAPAPAAMPMDDDWDLPADLDGNNAFVPLEAGE